MRAPLREGDVVYEIYTPSPSQAEASSPRNQMWLGDHGKPALFSYEPSLDAPHLYIYPLQDGLWDRERSWLARITGVNDDWSIQRDFLPKQWVRTGKEGYLEYMEYVLGEEMLYEIECELIEPMVARRGMHRIYLKYSTQQEAIVLLEREQFMDEMRRMRAAEFGDVRALVAEEKWGMARRAASWLGAPEERTMASGYVEQSYQRWLKALPELQGSDAHVQWARSLREEVLSRWPEMVRELLERSNAAQTQRMPREAIEALRVWVLSKQDALFWVEHRGVLTGEALWEIYLLEQLSMED